MRTFTPEKLEILRRLPLDGKPNKVRLAMALLDVKQSDVVEATGLPQSYVSDVMRGRFQSITVDNAAVFAEHFGCEILDLFPVHDETVTR